jgi:acetamidase/formamidase
MLTGDSSEEVELTTAYKKRDTGRTILKLVALNGTLDLMGQRFGLGRKEALALASVAVDVRATQLANGVRGVHAVLPHGAVRTP